MLLEQAGCSLFSFVKLSFLGKVPGWERNARKFGREPHCLFWTNWRERNWVAFENESFSAQRMKATFVSNLWSFADVYSVDRNRSLLDFLTWLDCR